MGRIQAVLISLVSFAIGAGLISTAVSQFSEDSTGAVVVIVLGAFMLLGGVAIFLSREKKKSFKDDLSELVHADQTGEADSDETDALLTSFRDALRSFFSARGVPQNSPLQSAATQLYWHVLSLQKRRMERKHVTMDFTAERKRYGGVSVTKERYFDGKYDITDAHERIAATRTYACNGRPVLKKTDDELAHYGILNAKPVSEGNRIICPNCGNETTRENLLDGCDFCGTKFTVEDLGARVSSFALRQDYQIAYDKYRDSRRYYGNRAFLVGALPAAVLSLLGFIGAWDATDTGVVMNVVATVLGTLFLAGSAGLFVRYAFWATVFPVIQAKKSLSYYTKKRLEQRKAAESKTEEVGQAIRAFDKLFSLEGFFSSVQNKLAAIHYAETPAEIRPFASLPLERFLASYQNVVDMDVAELSLLSYRADDKLQHIELRAALTLTETDGVRFTQREETLRLKLEKSAACKTEAVCGPSVLRCRSCGASLSLAEGGKCEYCGTELNLRDYDWVITDYRAE